jgi:site-specific recombinase XerD
MRQAYVNRGFSEGVTGIMVASCAASTQTQYKVYLVTWDAYLKTNNVDSTNLSLNDVLEYFLQLYNSGLGYSSINTARSALSLYVKPIEGYSIANHPIVIRFLKGIFKQRPSLPRYTEIWDVNILLKYIQDLPCNEDLSISLLTYKLVSLLSLTTAQRVQTINSILLSNVSYNNNIMYIRVTKMLKTSRSGVPQPVLCLPLYNNSKLCVQATFETYLKHTLGYRNHDDLLLSISKSYKPVSNQTVSRWLKEMLHLAGIDINKFKAHSYRSASTSEAYAEGVHIDEIFSQAGWSNNSICFAKFYNRSIDTNVHNYSYTVLNL